MKKRTREGHGYGKSAMFLFFFPFPKLLMGVISFWSFPGTWEPQTWKCISSFSGWEENYNVSGRSNCTRESDGKPQYPSKLSLSCQLWGILKCIALCLQSHKDWKRLEWSDSQTHCCKSGERNGMQAPNMAWIWPGLWHWKFVLLTS